ncbi:MAG TPA: hypothetical protein VF648_07095 [Pyrinomonadaceae bacterium]|jgi:hypothetical protein
MKFNFKKTSDNRFDLNIQLSSSLQSLLFRSAGWLAFVLGLIFTLLISSLSLSAQRPTALTENCPDQPPTVRVQMFVGRDGNAHINPCPGKQVLVNGSPLAGGGIFSDGSILFSKLNSGMVSNDVTLGSDSGTKITTEHAVKSYVDAVTGFVTYNSVQRANFNGVAAPVAGWTSSNGSFWFPDLGVTGNGYFSGGTFNPNGQQNLVAEGLYRSFIYWLGNRTQTGTISGLTNNQIYVVRIHSWKPAALGAPQANNFTVAVNGGTPVTVSGANDMAVVREITFTATGGTAPITFTTATSGDGLFVSAIEIFERVVTGSNTISSTTQLGKIKLSVPPADAANPIALGPNDPILMQAAGELNVSNYASLGAALTAIGSTEANLVVAQPYVISSNLTIPANVNLEFKANGSFTVNNGVTVILLGSVAAPPKKVFNLVGNGFVSFIESETRKVSVEWWGATPRDSVDDTAAIDAAAKSFGTTNSHGGTVFFHGDEYKFSTQLNWAQIANLTVEGSANENVGSPRTLMYTGSTLPAINLEATHGVRFKGMHFYTGTATNAVDGWFMRGGSGAASGDTIHLKIEHCAFEAPFGSLVTLLMLDRVIVSQIVYSNFYGGKIGIEGAVSSRDSNVILLEQNHFKLQSDAAIKSIGQWWTISNNTFSGGTPTSLAIDTNDAGNFLSYAVEFSNNYFESGRGYSGGDYPASAKIIQMYVQGATFSANTILQQGAAGTVIEFINDSAGIAFTGNTIAGDNDVYGVGGSATSIAFVGNKFIGTAWGVHPSLETSYTALGNTGLYDRTNGGYAAGESLVLGASGDVGVTMGKVTTIGGANSLGRIGVMDGATGYLNRSLGYFAPTNNNNPHIFFTWNGSSFQPRFQVDNSGNINYVPLLFSADNTHDIGAVGATRPRTGYFGTSVVTPAINVSGATASRALITDGSKNVTSSSVTSTELGLLSGVTGTLQTIAGTQTVTNKTFALGSNSLSGTTAQFNAALSDNDFATLAGTETLTNKTFSLGSNTLTTTMAQLNTAILDGDFASTASPTFSGTVTLSGLTAGSIPFAGTGGAITQSNAQIFWDIANNRLGIGTNAPPYALSFGAAMGFNRFQSGTGANDAVKFIGSSAGGATFGVQNSDATGFSGVEYHNNAGALAVFTGYRNSTGEFRVNNIASGGFIDFLIGGNSKLKILNNGNIQLNAPASDTGQALQVKGNGYFSGQLSAGLKALTDVATIAINFNDGNSQTVTLGGNRTFTFSNAVAGGHYTLFLKQDAIGSRIPSFPAGVKWQGGSAPVFSTGIGKVDVVTIWFDGTDFYAKADLNF